MGKKARKGDAAPRTQVPMSPVVLPECFAVISTAVEGLNVFLNTQEHDWSPVILTQPPSCRPLRQETLKATLVQLDAQQAELQRTIDSLLSAQQKLRRQRGMCKSALSPVSALPYDVLRCIFSQDLGVPASQMRFTKAVSAVCRDWRNVARDIPHLWAEFEIRTLESLRHLGPWLKRSGRKDLKLRVRIDELESPSWFKRVDDPIRIQFQSRLTEFDWIGPDSLSLFIVGLFNIDGKGIIFESLRSLSIGRPWDDENVCDEDLAVDLRKAVFPKLRTLDLAVPLVYTNDLTFPGLKTLEISGATFENEQLVFLQHAPKLRTLHVHGVKSCGLSYLNEVVSTEVLSLEDLNISESDHEAVTTILRFLEMPNLTTISIDMSNMGHEPPYSLWGYNPPSEDAGHLALPHPSNRLYHLVKSCTKLMDLTLTLPMGCIKAVVHALDSPDLQGAFPAPELRDLALIFWPITCESTACPNRNHIKEEARQLGDRLVSALRRRRSAGCDDLDTLSMSTCAENSDMEELVGDTEFTDCDCKTSRLTEPAHTINVVDWHDYVR